MVIKKVIIAQKALVPTTDSMKVNLGQQPLKGSMIGNMRQMVALEADNKGIDLQRRQTLKAMDLDQYTNVDLNLCAEAPIKAYSKMKYRTVRDLGS